MVNNLQQPALLAENEEYKSKSDENESDEEESGSDSDNEEEDGEGDNSKKKSITRPKNETAEDRRVSLQVHVNLIHCLIYQLFIYVQVLGTCMSMVFFLCCRKGKKRRKMKSGKRGKTKSQNMSKSERKKLEDRARKRDVRYDMKTNLHAICILFVTGVRQRPRYQ